MELVQELFLTAIVALIFSFFVAKLVSIATNGGGKSELGLKSSETVRVMGTANLRVRSSRSQSRVRFVEEVEEVDEFGRRRSVQKSEESRCGEGFEEKRCDSEVICGSERRVEVLGLPEKSSEQRSTQEDAMVQTVGGTEVDEIKGEIALTNLDELVVKEGSEITEVCEVDDGVIEEGNAVKDFVLEGKIVENVEADGKIDVRSSSDDIVLARGEEIRDAERREKIDRSVEADDGKIDAGSSKDCIVGDQGEEDRGVDRRENQESGIKEEVAVTNSDGLVETDGVSKEGIAVTDLVLEEKIDENVGADSEIDARSSIDGIVVEQGEEDRDVETRENQERGIEGGLNEGDEKEGMVSADEDNKDVERRENQASGIEGGMNEGEEKEGSVGDEDDDDWEGIERTELDAVFAEAANYVASGGKDDQLLANVGSDFQMQLYGLHKVAMEGPCHEPQPMAIMISSRAKWNAWQRLGNMNPDVAMEQYVALLSDKVPGWMEGKSSRDGNAESSESGTSAALDPNISTDPYNQLNSTKKRESELDSGTDGGDLTKDLNSVNKE